MTDAPFIPGSDTSRLAAEEKAPDLLNDETRILAIVKSRGDHGCTNDELKVILGNETSGPTARVKSLIDKGLLRDSGLRRVSRSRRQQRVLIVGVDPNPIQGPSQDRPLRRPRVAELRRALVELRRLWAAKLTSDQDLAKLGTWIADVVRREGP